MIKSLLAIVGMPGAGKTEVARMLEARGFPLVRFGEETDRGLRDQNLPLTEENERVYRDKLRAQLGMAAYAIKAKPRIEELLRQHDVIVVDGLYSWEEYTYLKKDFPALGLICVYADPILRHKRLSARSTRPLLPEEGKQRDIDEIEKLNKGGPIANSDYLIDNSGTVEELKLKVEALLQRLGYFASEKPRV